MSYVLAFTDQTVDPISKAPITVPSGTVNSTSTDLNLTGKGAANIGKLSQENVLHVLENFASPTAPSNPTIGQTWYDSSAQILKVLTSTSPTDIWKSVGNVQVTEVGDSAPSPAALGDMWFQRTGTASGVLYMYTGIGRYPTTATTIGGWDQIFPRVETAAGREEYDSLRRLLEQLAGEGVSSYGSGAIGRVLNDLTNFAELDRDLRAKYAALGADTNVLISVGPDSFITQQDLSSTLFLRADANAGGFNQNEFIISGNRTSQVNGSIFVNGVSTTVPGSTIETSQFLDEAYIMWDQTQTVFSPENYLVVRFNVGTGGWEFDNNTAWTPFTPSVGHFIIGTVSTLQVDNTTTAPGGKTGFVWAHAVPLVGASSVHLKVEPNSHDWDELLAAAKFALERLELPPGFARTISPMPFVTDGLQVRSTLSSLPQTDVRYPTGHRRSGRRFGSIAQMHAFTETVNALNTGIASRFSLKGINGNSGTNPQFAASTAVTAIGTIPTSSAASTTRTGTIAVSFTNHDEFYRWLGAGHGIQIEVTHAGGGNANDTNLRALLSAVGTIRVTTDKTRFFGQALPLTLSRSVVDQGIWNGDNTAVLLATQTVSGVTLNLSVTRTGLLSFTLTVSITAAGNFSVQTSLRALQIRDTTTLPGPVNVYPTIASAVVSLT